MSPKISSDILSELEKVIDETNEISINQPKASENEHKEKVN
jgi:hypothetical protein